MDLKDILLILVAVAAIAAFLIYKKAMAQTLADLDENAVSFDKEEKLPYRRKYLLTKNEYWFYKTLKQIADKNGYSVIAKVRLADLIEVNSEVERKDYLKYFGKIKSKHIDFILCDGENLYPLLLIELNDNSHKKEDRADRDGFIEKIAEKTGYKILFVSGTQGLEEKILSALSEKQDTQAAAVTE